MHGKDKGYMKLVRMYMTAIKMYFAEGPVVAASEAAGETAVAASTFQGGHDSVTSMRVRSEVSFKTGSGDDSSADGGID